MELFGEKQMEQFKLIINGKQYAVLAKPNWTLLYVLREVIGLTGTKCGCNTGACGTCKVIIDGEAVSSCLVQVRTLENKQIETIEGLSKGDNLHPIQQTFIDCGAVQCGFCTPGMIMSAKALLDKNPDPTEAEIRKAINGNLCRCTGYVKIVASIKKAAKMLQSKEGRETSEQSQRLGSSYATKGIIGTGVPVRDAKLKVTGAIAYTADMTFPHMLHAKVLFSPIAHGKIVNIDTSRAEALPGVEAVVCYKNAPNVRYNGNGEDQHDFPSELVFDQVVRYVGDKVAAVAAETLEIAEEAIKLIEVEYEELPFYLDPKEAMKEGAYPIHENGNILQEVNLSSGDVEAAMKSADRIYEDTYTLPAIHHSAMEPHVSIANYDRSGKLTVYTPTQDVFGQRVNLAKVFQIPMNRVRIINPVMGGGFGGKIDLITEPITALLAMKTYRPVKLVFTRREDIPSSRTRHAMEVTIKTGVMNDGTIVAQDITSIINAGAQTSCTMSVTWAMGGKYFKLHKNQNIRFRGIPVYTNCAVASAMRGFGSPQAFFGQQRQMNQIAKELGINITDMQLLNLVEPWDRESGGNMTTGNARPRDCVKLGMKYINWDACVKEMEEAAGLKGRYRIGIGMAVAAHGNGLYNIMPDTTGIIIKMNEDGSATLYTGVSDMGNGSVTLQTMAVSEILGISLERIACIQADTEATMFDLGAYASRGTFVGLQAAKLVAEKVREKLSLEASELLGESTENLEFRDNYVYSLNDESKQASLGELVMYAHNKNNRDICVTDTFSIKANAVSYGAHFAKVQVDTFTGQVKMLDYASVHDIGRAINPMSLEGQMEGSVQMGIGYALSEEIQYNEKGKIINTNFQKYHIQTAEEMPHIHVGMIEEYEASGPFGAKSIGECAVVPSIGAIANAVSNALDCDFHDLPLRPDRVLEAWHKKNE